MIVRKTEIRVEPEGVFFERGRRLAKAVDQSDAIPPSRVVAFGDVQISVRQVLPSTAAACRNEEWFKGRKKSRLPFPWGIRQRVINLVRREPTNHYRTPPQPPLSRMQGTTAPGNIRTTSSGLGSLPRCIE